MDPETIAAALSMSKCWDEILQRDNANQTISSELVSAIHVLGPRFVLRLLCLGVHSLKEVAE